MSDFFINLIVVLLSFLNLVFNLLKSDIKNSLWWCNPRGLMALPLFLSTSGFSIFYLAYGRYPNLFGFHEENFFPVLIFLVFAGWAFTAGTFLTISEKIIRTLLPALSFNKNILNRFLLMLFVVLVLVSIVTYYGLSKQGFADLIIMHYGADQWNTVNNSPWLRASVLGTPLLCILILIWGMTNRSFFHPGLLLMSIVTILPAVFLGGRKDMIFIMIALAFSGSVKRGFNSLKPILYSAVIILAFNYLQTLSRDSDSLELSSRVKSISTIVKEENKFVGQISVALPIVPTVTAAMTVFPDKDGFYLGGSYLQTIAGTLLPKIIFGDSFISPNSNFHDLYYPDVLNFSMDYSLAAEGYQNYGLFGIVIAYFLLGFFLGNLKKVATVFDNSLWKCINLVVFISGMWCLRSDSNTFFKMSFYVVVVVLLLFFISKLKLLRPSLFHKVKVRV